MDVYLLLSPEFWGRRNIPYKGRNARLTPSQYFRDLLRHPSSLVLATCNQTQCAGFTSLSCDCDVAAYPSVYRVQGTMPSLYLASACRMSGDYTSSGKAIRETDKKRTPALLLETV